MKITIIIRKSAPTVTPTPITASLLFESSSSSEKFENINEIHASLINND